MAQTKVEIKGLDRLLNDIRGKFPKQYKAATTDAMKKSVLDVEGWAKQNAPVDTGLLRSSIHSEVKATMGDVVGIVGSRVEYAPFVEFGSGKPRGVGRIPFMRPAVLEHANEILNNFKDALDKLVNGWGD